MVSALVLTYNEERNLQACLNSLAWCNDIVVLDSFSNDRTVEIAQDFGARVLRRRFDNWAAHHNWAAQNVDFKGDWVYYSDADEVVTEELRDEMLATTEDVRQTHVAYRMRYKNYFMGHWIKHCGIYPTWILRLYRPERVRWERVVNPLAVIDGTEGRLQHHFLHYSFNKGLTAWFEKHNTYSSGEADESLRSVRVRDMDWTGLIAMHDHPRQRQALKKLSFRLPHRPTLRFLYMFFWRLGFLDGSAGWNYCRLLSMYEAMIELKVKELHRRQQGLPM